MLMDQKIPMPTEQEVDGAVEKIIEKGLGPLRAEKRKKRWLLGLSGAAALALLLAIGIPLLTSRKPSGIQAVRPAATAKKMSAEEFVSSGKAVDWAMSQKEKTDASLPLQTDLRPFYESIISRLLSKTEGNAVCSPINIYMALAMLSEVTAGNTQKQILEALNSPDPETLRKNISMLWESNYADTPILKSLLANSFWLGDRYEYNRSTLKQLAESFYADSFAGTPGSKEMDRALQKWTDDNTGGLLSEYTKDLHLDSDTVLALVSTIWFNASWEIPFYADNNTEEIFHGAHGDAKVEMMHKENPMDVFETERFISVGIPLKESGYVYFCLPKGDIDVGELAVDPDLLNMIKVNDHWATGYNATVSLSLPKFTVSRQADLMNILPAMGITDVTDPRLADFSPLLAKKEYAGGLYLGRADHMVKVSVDEEGFIGAASTMLVIPAAGWPEKMDFIVDRPFLFLVTGQDNSVLFAGIVRDIE